MTDHPRRRTTTRRACFSALIGCLATLLGAPNSILGQNEITPPPYVASFGNCRAVVTFAWDVSAVPGANGAFYELKRGQLPLGPSGDLFTNPSGPEPVRLLGAAGGLVGATTIDLRDYGPVLNGTAYAFRVVAKNGNNDVALRSESLLFGISDQTLVEATPIANADYTIRIDWTDLDDGIRNCSDQVYYEVSLAPFTSQGSEPGRIASGSAPIGTNALHIDLSDQPADEYFVRLVGKYQGQSPENDVGERGDAGTGVSVSLSNSNGGETDPPPSSHGQGDPAADDRGPPRILSFEYLRHRPPPSATASTPVTMRYASAGVAPDSVQFGSCSEFDAGGPRRRRADVTGSNRVVLRLPPGKHLVCLRLSRSIQNGTLLSDLAQARVTIEPPAVAEPEAPTITRFDTESGENIVRGPDMRLRVRTEDAVPTEYRFGEFETFATSAQPGWQAWPGGRVRTLTYRLTPSYDGQREVWIQTRKDELESEPAGFQFFYNPDRSEYSVGGVGGPLGVFDVRPERLDELDRLECPPEHPYVVGLRVVAAPNGIVNLGFRCARATSYMTLAASAGDAPMFRVTRSQPGWRLTSTTFLCPANQVLMGIEAWGGQWVDSIRGVECAGYDGSGRGFQDDQIGPPGGREEFLRCDRLGDFVTSLHARFKGERDPMEFFIAACATDRP